MTDDRPGLHLAPPPGPPPKRARPKVKKLRLLALLIPLALLAGVSTMFGMLMAVAADLPSLEQLPQVAKRKNSVLLDRWGDKLTTLTANDGRVIVRGDQIGPYVKYAVIAIEDQRFYENAGVDLRGTARALYQDVVAGHAAQGGSTIAQQFIKNALKAQQERTLIQKVREAALAYHLTRKWPKDRILTEYLNTVYFGNGAYGVEAAARTYFGADPNHEGCGTGGKMCAAELAPHEAALLGAIIASPSAYDPLAHPEAATRRRNLVLRKMLEQGRITQVQFQESVTQPLTSKVTPPRLDAPDNAEYFVSWVRQNLVDQVGPQRAFEGDLRVYTTLDLQLQKAAEQAVQRQLPYESGPSASLVAIDNQTGEVRAMVGGRDYATTPFNLATQGQRQPGSSIKPFIMAQALREGVSPNSVWPSRKREFCVTRRKGKCVEVFTVNNFEDAYAGSSTLARALTFSDNSVFAAIGLQVGTKKVARLAERMGIRTPVSSNPAMTLGGLGEGVTPLDMAHAYETFATFGLRVSGTLGTSDAGPVGIDKIVKGSGKDAETVEENERRRTRVLSQNVAGQARQLLTGPVQYGSGTRAAFGGFAAGKTGTTENSGDAWFVGFTDRWTIAVWVGYPEGFKPMETEFRGEPVTGGTFPALIWHDFVVAANAVTDERVDKERARKGLPPREETQTTTTPPATVTPAPVEGAAPSQDVAPPATTTGGTGAGTTGGAGTGGGTETPATPAPAAPATPAVPETPAPTPAPTPTPAPVDPNAGAPPAADDTGATQAPADPATP